MKAAGFLLNHYQKPMTILGFPIRIFLIAAFSTVGTMMFSFQLLGGLFAFVLFLCILVFWAWLNKKIFRGDHHADLILLEGFNRWGFKSKHKYIIVGGVTNAK